MSLLLLAIGVLVIIVGLFVPLIPLGVLCFIGGGLLILFAVSAYRGTAGRWRL